MTLVSKPDPRSRLITAVLIDALLVAFGVAGFVISSNPLWIILALLAGAVISAPMMISAMREMKERNNASR